MTKASVPPPTYAPLSESITPTTYLVGERGPESIIPVTDAAPPWTNGEPGPIPHVEPVIPVKPSVIPDYSEMRMTLQNILTMDVCTEPGQEEPHSVMRRVAAQGLGVEEPEPVMSSHDAGQHGWVCYNSGPCGWYWFPTLIECQHELSNDIRPATHLEKTLFNAIGNGLEKDTLPVFSGLSVPGYEHLADILTAAYDQSARGKGKERHANAAPWHEQRINTIPAQQKSIMDGLGYQVQKKTLEAADMAERGDLDAAEREMLGAIVYAAACIEQIRRAKLIKA